jgi:hypothetical protein
LLLRQLVRSLEVLQQVVFVQSTVVVEVVASGIVARVERHALVTGPVFGDVGVTAVAVVLGKCDSHGAGSGGIVFLMTGDAQPRVEHFDTCSVSRVGELGFRMRIVRPIQLRSVTSHAGGLKVLGASK